MWVLDFCPRLDRLEFRILGLGRDMERLKKRATEYHPQVMLEEFSDQVFVEALFGIAV